MRSPRLRARDERGASAVEFALVLPVLLLLVVGIIEFGRGFQVSGTLSAAARDAVREVASSLDPGITDAQITITPGSCVSGTGTTTVRLTIDYELPYLTGIFGESIGLTGTGVMRCGG